MIEQISEREARQAEAATRRAANIMATLYNVRRTKKSDPIITADDFLEPDQEKDRLTPKEALRYMNRWAARMNKGAQA